MLLWYEQKTHQQYLMGRIMVRRPVVWTLAGDARMLNLERAMSLMARQSIDASGQAADWLVENLKLNRMGEQAIAASKSSERVMR